MSVKIQIPVVLSLGLLGACSLFESTKDSTADQSALSSSSSSSSSSSQSALVDSLLKQASGKMDSTEIKMISSLAPTCQEKYLKMSITQDPIADQGFFADSSCFASVVKGMTPPNLSAECQSLYQAPFAYYQQNWSAISKCEQLSDPSQDPNCKTAMEPLMSKSSQFHSKCGAEPPFPWEKNHQGGDSTMTKNPDEMKAFCADPNNANKPECLQFAKCNPLFEKQGQLNQSMSQEMSLCSAEDGACYENVKMSYKPKFEALQTQLSQNGCLQGGNNGSEICPKLFEQKGQVQLQMDSELGKCGTDVTCQEKVKQNFAPKMTDLDNQLSQNKCISAAMP